MKIKLVAGDHVFYIQKPDVCWLPEYILVFDYKDAADFSLVNVAATHHWFSENYPDLTLHNEA